VVAGNCFGFIGNRMFEVYTREALFLLEEGALPHQIDAALEAWGFAMGPLKVGDLAGLDIGYDIRRSQGLTDPATRPSETGRYGGTVADRLVQAGRKGQKTQKGFYDYTQGRQPVRDAAVEELVVATSAELGITRRDISDREIVERCILGLVNEGYKTVDDGIAGAVGDVDVVYAAGYGARQRQPMHFAQSLGPRQVLEAVLKYQKQMPDVPHWVPASGLARDAA